MRLTLVIVVALLLGTACSKHTISREALKHSVHQRKPVSYETFLSPVTKIVNGEDAEENAYPFMVRLFVQFDFSESGYGYVCGGSIIAERWVITAAHCVLDDYDNLVSAADITITAGDHDWSETSSTEQVFRVKAIVANDFYGINTLYDADAALLYLTEDISYTAAVQPIDLVSDSSLYDAGTSVEVTGWGSTESGSLADILQHLETEIVSTAECREYWGDYITTNMFCTGEVPIDSYSDSGDSGGPVFCTRNGQTHLLGLVSWGAYTPNTESYSVETKILALKDWIEETRDSDDIVTSLTARSGPAIYTYDVTRLANQVIKISASSSTQYIQVEVFPSRMQSGTVVYVYSGSDQLTDTLLGMVSSETAWDKTYTKTTRGGSLCIVIAGQSSIDPSVSSSGRVQITTEMVATPGDGGVLECAPGYWPCADKRKCLPDSFVCDEWSDCYDGSDETMMACASTSQLNISDFNPVVMDQTFEFDAGTHSIHVVTSWARGSQLYFDLSMGGFDTWVHLYFGQTDIWYLIKACGNYYWPFPYPESYNEMTQNNTVWTLTYHETYASVLMNGSVVFNRYYNPSDTSCRTLSSYYPRTASFYSGAYAPSYYLVSNKTEINDYIEPSTEPMDYSDYGDIDYSSNDGDSLISFHLGSINNTIQFQISHPINSTNGTFHVNFTDNNPDQYEFEPSVKITVLSGMNTGLLVVSGCSEYAAPFRLPTWDVNQLGTGVQEWTLSFANHMVSLRINGYETYTIDARENALGSCIATYWGGNISHATVDTTDYPSVSHWRVLPAETADDYSLSLWNPDDLNSNNTGVVLAHASDMSNGLICNHGMGRNEASAICKYFGFRYGLIVDAYDFKNLKEKWNPFEGYEYVATDIECDADSDGNVPRDCEHTLYQETSVPCQDGDQLAVRCANQPFQMTSSLQVKNKRSGVTKFRCEVHAMQYGQEFSVEENIAAAMLTRSQSGEYYIIDADMQFRRNRFKSRIQNRNSLPNQCYICLAGVRDTMLFTYSTNDENCDYNMNTVDIGDEIAAWRAVTSENSGE